MSWSLRLLVVLLGASSCVSFPHAELRSGTAVLEVVTGPVVCGPVGFRKVPLQSRWGEYVRVTVQSPGALRGTVLVHAGGVPQEPRSWDSAAGPLIVEARFANEDPDSRFALERERPIDVTLVGLEGACEGAVFTVEHGALVPSIDERSWMVELERRGGPALAARREAARVAAEARRQAHYAQWESRQVEVSAEVVVQAEVIRETHYAAWEARRAPQSQEIEVTQQSPLPQSGAGPAERWAAAEAERKMRRGEATQQGGGEGQGGQGEGINVIANTSSSCTSGTCAGGALGGSVVVSNGSSSCASASCSGSVVASSVVVASSSSSSCSIAVNPGEPLTPALSPLAQGEGASVATVSSPGEWSQPSDLSLRANADLGWAPPPTPQLVQANVAVESSWSQPFEPRLETVAVSTESRVATSATYVQPSVQRVETTVVVDPGLSLIVPALFNVMFRVGAAAAQPVHAAQPISR